MMIKPLAPALMALTLAACGGEPKPMFSDTLNTGYAFCMTKDALERLSTAQVNGATTVISQLIGYQCMNSFSEGTPFEVVDTTFTMANVLIHTEKGPVEVWTYREAVMEGK